MGKSTISMAIFNSYVSHYQRVSCEHLQYQLWGGTPEEDNCQANSWSNRSEIRSNTWSMKFPKNNKMLPYYSQWIGLRENLQETMVFTIKYRLFRLKFSHHPILWYSHKSQQHGNLCPSCSVPKKTCHGNRRQNRPLWKPLGPTLMTKTNKYILQPIVLVLGYSVGWEDLIPIRRPIMTNSWLRGFSSQDSSSFCSLGSANSTKPKFEVTRNRVNPAMFEISHLFPPVVKKNHLNLCTNPPNFFGERRFALDFQSPVAGTYLPTVSGLPGIPLSPWIVFWSAHTGNQRKRR